MNPWMVTMSYELAVATPPDIRKLLRAELAARKWLERSHEYLLPRGTVFQRRPAGTPEETVTEVHEAAGRELRQAAEAVSSRGAPCKVERAWIHVSGGGMVGLVHFDEGASP